MLDQITPLILTLDEAPNIGRVLDRLSWAKDIVVVDSFSRDATTDIVRRYPNTRLFQRQFDLHANQWNFGLKETGITTAWVLALDADFVVPEELGAGIERPRPGSGGRGLSSLVRLLHTRPPVAQYRLSPCDRSVSARARAVRRDGHTPKGTARGTVVEPRAHPFFTMTGNRCAAGCNRSTDTCGSNRQMTSSHFLRLP